MGYKMECFGDDGANRWEIGIVLVYFRDAVELWGAWVAVAAL